MNNRSMVQFVSFVDSVLYLREVVSAVSYLVILIPVLTRSSILIFYLTVVYPLYLIISAVNFGFFFNLDYM